MRIDAVGVCATDLRNAVAFYELLSFTFSEFTGNEDHIEAVTKPDGTRLMIDSQKLMSELIGERPKPGNHSSFAILYDSPAEVDATVERVQQAGYTVVAEPWDAVWGQRYAIVQDADGYRIDLFAVLP